MTIHARYPAARPTRVCAATGRALAPGEAYVATLAEAVGERDGEGPTIRREDFSADAWARGARPRRLIGAWRATLDAEVQPGAPVLDDPALLELFLQPDDLAGGGDDPEPDAPDRRPAFRFVLALLLVRKRLLDVVAQTPDSMRLRLSTAGARAWGRSTAATEVLVRDPGLDERSIMPYLDQLGVLMAPQGGKGGAS